MAMIANQVRDVGGTITVLGEHSNKISSVVQVIKDVADQTNLLALNAAIEAAQAAKAGEAIVAIQESNTRVVDVVKNINDAMSEQGAASQDIAQRVERVAQASEESSTSVGVSADTAKNIHELSMVMRNSVARFRV